MAPAYCHCVRAAKARRFTAAASHYTQQLQFLGWAGQDGPSFKRVPSRMLRVCAQARQQGPREGGIGVVVTAAASLQLRCGCCCLLRDPMLVRWARG